VTRTRGVFSVCPTPFKPGGELDLKSLERLINFLLEAGINGLTVLGVMGELHKLNTFERRRVIETAVAAVRGAVPVWAGVRDLGLAGALEQARRAEDLGADAILVAPLANVDESIQVAYYRQIVDSVRVPVVIHDFPELFAAKVGPQAVARLVREAGVSVLYTEDPPVGPKVTAVRALSGDSLRIFTGLGGLHFPEELERGADGVVTGFSFPEILLKVYALHSAGDTEQAASVFDRYCSLIRYEFQPLIALALRKYSYMRRGLIESDAVRAPARALDGVSKAEYETVVRRLGLALPSRPVQFV